MIAWDPRGVQRDADEGVAAFGCRAWYREAPKGARMLVPKQVTWWRLVFKYRGSELPRTKGRIIGVAAVALGEALLAAAASVGHCGRCNTLTELALCDTCASPRRDATVLCVVESPADQLMIEQSLAY